ncbi:MAG TPA: UDP-N-acetylmuramate dehydrogenase [Firmicutes bacterium]|nr:UDP-N-acetylmuramate dehydrogenase [Candidatus Fermentithermobacillaceae bacterium]
MDARNIPVREELVEIARSLKNSRAYFSEPMSNHTSFKIGGPCDLLIIPGTAEDAVKAWTLCKNLSVPVHIIGNGTNLLVKDGGIRGCVLKMAPDLAAIGKTGPNTLTVKAGTLLPRLVQACLDYELSGLEFAVGIPGSMGGAVAMNAGAYGGDMGSLVSRVQVSSPEGRIEWLSQEELDFSYRHSLFLEREDLLILTVDMELVPGQRDNIYRVMAKHAKEREEKQPLDLPSAGSAFRRPQGRFVGPMIEALGLKGFSYGGARVSPKHAGFIVNEGNATAKDVLTLMKIIQDKVFEAYGVCLEPEIVVLGEDPVEA